MRNAWLGQGSRGPWQGGGCPAPVWAMYSARATSLGVTPLASCVVSGDRRPLDKVGRGGPHRPPKVPVGHRPPPPRFEAKQKKMGKNRGTHTERVDPPSYLGVGRENFRLWTSKSLETWPKSVKT